LWKIHLSLGGNAAKVSPETFLGYVYAVVQSMLALDGFHLIFEAELQLFQTDFFELFVFAKITFLGEYFEAF
jgi:hypothetical protein